MIRMGRRRLLAGGAAAMAAGLAGCNGQADEEEDPSERGPLSVATFAFASEQPTGYGEYEEQPDATYGYGDTMWLYVELDGLAGEPVEDGDGVQIDLEQTRRLEHEEHGLLDESSKLHDDVLQPPQLDQFFAMQGLEIGDEYVAGEYTFTLEFTDSVSETSDSESGTFYVEE